MNKLILLFLLVFISQLAKSQIRWEQIKPISAQMEKTTVVGNDIVLIEDSEASGLRKSIKISNLFADLLDSINSKVSNEAYDAATWDGVTTIAPSKNAVRDAIQNMTLAVYCADSMVVNRGTLDAGAVTDLCALGGTDVNISELTGADPLRVSFKFSNVERMSNFVFYGDYVGSASHIVWVEIYNPTADSWVLLGTFGTTTTKQWFSFPIYTPNTYISSGVVRVRINHQSSGVSSHDLILDYVDVNFGGAGGGSTITAANVSVTPVGNIASTNVQSSLQELDSEKEPALTKGDLTEDIIGMQFDQTRQVIGGAAVLSLTSGYSIPTTASVTRASNHVTNDLDTLITNEIQTIDTFRIASNVLEVSLLNDAQPKKSISLNPYIDLQQTIPWSSSITHDYNNGQDAYVFLTGNVNSYTLTNVPEAGEGEIVIVQDGIGGWGISNILLSGVSTLYVDDLELTTTSNSGSATLVNHILNVPTYTLSGLGGIGYTNLSSTATGLSYNNTTGVFSLTSGYTIPTTLNTNYWSSLDPSTINEGILGVAAMSSTTVRLTSNTDGADGSIFAAGKGMKIEPTITATDGGRITYRMGTPSDISGLTTNLLSDTTHTHKLSIYGTPSTGYLAGYDATYGLAWKAPSLVAHTLDSHSNVTITSNSSGELLKWNGSAWINNTLAEAGIQPLATVLTNTTASFTTAQETKLSGIAAGAEVNVNADWNAVSGDAQILNKPTIPTVAGSNTQIQYNNSGVFGAETDFTYDTSKNLLSADTVKVVSRAYNATTWNGSTRVVTEDAVRDKIESIQSAYEYYYVNTSQTFTGGSDGYINIYTTPTPTGTTVYSTIYAIIDMHIDAGAGTYKHVSGNFSSEWSSFSYGIRRQNWTEQYSDYFPTSLDAPLIPFNVTITPELVNNGNSTATFRIKVNTPISGTNYHHYVLTVKYLHKL
jgi:hypothetical protein